MYTSVRFRIKPLSPYGAYTLSDKHISDQRRSTLVDLEKRTKYLQNLEEEPEGEEDGGGDGTAVSDQDDDAAQAEDGEALQPEEVVDFAVGLDPAPSCTPVVDYWYDLSMVEELSDPLEFMEQRDFLERCV